MKDILFYNLFYQKTKMSRKFIGILVESIDRSINIIVFYPNLVDSIVGM